MRFCAVTTISSTVAGCESPWFEACRCVGASGVGADWAGAPCGALGAAADCAIACDARAAKLSASAEALALRMKRRFMNFLPATT